MPWYMQLLLLLALMVGGIALVILLKALTARICTGKWPHECEKSRAIYRNLP